MCMFGDEDCRTAVFGKTERTVGWEGNGQGAMKEIVRHWKWETYQGNRSYFV